MTGVVEERTIFLARHGSREDSENPDWARSAENPYDPGLSLSGMREARRLGERVSRERVAYLYSSPYLRAVQTAQFCAGALGLPIRVDAGFGEWLNAQWFAHRPRTLPLQWLKGQGYSIDEHYSSVVHPEFPESKEVSVRRFGRTVEGVLRETDGGILIVGHGATFEGVTASLLQGQPFDPNADPASLSRLDGWSGSWRLGYSNDTSFIRPLP